MTVKKIVNVAYDHVEKNGHIHPRLGLFNIRVQMAVMRLNHKIGRTKDEAHKLRLENVSRRFMAAHCHITNLVLAVTMGEVTIDDLQNHRL